MGYRTIAQAVTASFIEKKSEFIATLVPVQTADAAIACIEEVRKANRKARHNVYAYILRENHMTRYSDDGEPQGTAGVPVLNVLQKQNLTDVCCVVTRYFGGILLGGGGLVRAYSHSAALAVEAQIVAKEPIAQKAIPDCNITYMDKAEMKQALSGYLEVLFGQDPQSVGGGLPEDDFYYVAE